MKINTPQNPKLVIGRAFQIEVNQSQNLERSQKHTHTKKLYRGAKNYIEFLFNNHANKEKKKKQSKVPGVERQNYQPRLLYLAISSLKK